MSRETRREQTTRILVGIKGKQLAVVQRLSRGDLLTDGYYVLSPNHFELSLEEGGYPSLYSNKFVYFDFSMTSPPYLHGKGLSRFT